MKSFSTFFNTYIINEELDKKLETMLNTQGHVGSKIEHMINTGHENTGNGSSRRYFKLKSPKKIILDGQPVEIPHGVKLAQRGDLDNYHNHSPLGNLQNANESQLIYRPHSVIIPHPTKPGEYVTNPRGVLAPVFKSHEGGDWLEMGHVTPLEKFSSDEKYTLMHSKAMPDVTHSDIQQALFRLEFTKHNPMSDIGQYHRQILNTHPVANGLARLVAHTGLGGTDLVEDNWGVWQHPITKKMHPVVLDYGASTDLLSKYRAARINKINDKRFPINEALSKKIQSVLDDDNASRREKFMAVKYNGKSSLGGSRAYKKHTIKTPITLDGTPITVDIGTKIAFPKRNTDKNDYGVLQNQAETDDKFIPHYIIQRGKDGSYKTNPTGIIAPVIRKSKDDVYHEMLHATPLDEYIKKDKHIFNTITKTPEHPNGVDFNDLANNVTKLYSNSYREHQQPVDEHILAHPLAKSITHLIATTDAHPEDFSYDFNWGVWKHPVTKKLHPVIIDYGLTKQIMKDEYPLV